MIVDYLLKNSIKSPKKNCVIDKNRVLTYEDMATEIKQFASYLISKEIKENDRVLLCLPNSCELLVGYYGIMLIGATTCLIDYNMNLVSIDSVVDELNPDLILTIEERPDLLSRFPNCEKYPNYSTLKMQADFNESKLKYSNNIALIMYTSGTTGKPKGVKITHKNIEFTAKSIINWAKIDAKDVELTTLPLSHSFGLSHFHCYSIVGGTMYIETGLFDTKRIFSLLDKATSLPLTPTGVKFLLKYYKNEFQLKAKNLKYIIIGAAPINPKLIDELFEILPNTELYTYYGLTEASRSTYLHCNAYRDKLNSAGKPSPNVNIKISNHNLVNKKEGEILIYGDNVSVGYLNEGLSSPFKNGWFYSGDIGFIDNDGFLHVTGRGKEQINVGGYKVSPLEIETLISTFSGVTDVAVIGVPDNTMGESIVAFIVTEEEKQNTDFISKIKNLCLTEIEAYKIPRKILFISNIPRTNNGKIQRNKLLSLFKEKSGVLIHEI